MTRTKPETTNPLPTGSGFSYAQLRAHQAAAIAAKRTPRRDLQPLDWPTVREQLHRRKEAERRMPPPWPVH